ncbi:MAG: putative nucleotidyltransferase substrate binding domain-containing protein [Solirubrobacteraceae bacterium]
MEDLAAFLAAHPPFDALAPEERAAVAAAATRREVPAGAAVLVEDGPPAAEWYVVASGAMELVHDGEVVDLLEPGEPFGHPSLLSGMAPAFTVRAHDPGTVVLVVPQDVARDVLGQGTGAEFVARSLRDRLVRTGHVAHALPSLHRARVGDLVRGEPLTLAAGQTASAAAAAMTAAGVSAALVPAGDRVCLVTDQDLRAGILAAGLPSDAPVSAAMREPVLVAAEEPAGDAVIDLLQRGAHEVCVTGPGGTVIGIVTAEEMLGRQESPFIARRAIEHAADEAALEAAARDLRPMFLALLRDGLDPAQIQRALTHYSDAATLRLIDFALARHGPAPAPWAWLALGSVARREVTLASDQDNALAYGDGGDPDATDAWFARFAADVNRGLARCGFGEDISGVLASDASWRLPRAAWIEVFEECLAHPNRSRLVRAAVAFDFRHVAGGLEITAPLAERIREAPAHPAFLEQLARAAIASKPPLGFRRGITLGKQGAGPGRFDVKRGGITPIASLARYHAVANGITVSGTVPRLEAAEAAGALDPAAAELLRDAFEVVCRVRLEHHAAQLRDGEDPDNAIEPGELPPLVRTELREAFRAVAQAQRPLQVYARPGL